MYAEFQHWLNSKQNPRHWCIVFSLFVVSPRIPNFVSFHHFQPPLHAHFIFHLCLDIQKMASHVSKTSMPTPQTPLRKSNPLTITVHNPQNRPIFFRMPPWSSSLNPFDLRNIRGADFLVHKHTDRAFIHCKAGSSSTRQELKEKGTRLRQRTSLVLRSQCRSVGE